MRNTGLMYKVKRLDRKAKEVVWEDENLRGHSRLSGLGIVGTVRRQEDRDFRLVCKGGL